MASDESVESITENDLPRDEASLAAVLFQSILGVFGVFLGFVMTAGSALSAGGTIHMLFLLLGVGLLVSSAYVLYHTGASVYQLR